MAYQLDSTAEVQNILSELQTVPDVFDDSIREAYIEVARNKALRRLLKADIERIDTEYKKLVAQHSIDEAVEVFNKLTALLNILETVEAQSQNPIIPEDIKSNALQSVRNVIGEKLEQFRSKVLAAEPPKLLNQKVAMGAADEERQISYSLDEWQRGRVGLQNTIFRWKSETSVSDVLTYAQRGQSIVEGYSHLIDEANRITPLVVAQNERFVEKK